MSATTTEVGYQLTLSNYRVEYHAPDLNKGHVFEPRCAILADDAEFDGKTVRVFDVPDPDESQRAVAQFACDAMNQHERLLLTLRRLQTWLVAPALDSYTLKDMRQIIADVLDQPATSN